MTYSTGTMANINPLKYRGYYHDVESGFYYLQSRYYDPAIGRFINADEPELFDVNINTNQFVYSGNNPVVFKDESGDLITAAIMATIAFCGVMGALIGGVTAAAAGGDATNIFLGALNGAITFAIGAIPGIGPTAAIAACSTVSFVTSYASSVHSQRANGDEVDYALAGATAAVSASFSAVGTSVSSALTSAAGETVRTAATVSTSYIIGGSSTILDACTGSYITERSRHHRARTRGRVLKFKRYRRTRGRRPGATYRARRCRGL